MKTPWHLWVVGLLALLWNGGGAFDYLMTQLDVESYMAMLTDDQRAYLDMRPVWFDAVWAVGVWFAVLGSLLLLLRSGWSQLAFLVSIAGLIASSVWSYLIATPPAPEVMGGFIIWFTLAVLVILILLWGYARAMTARGVLR
jgi:hypothetical protein